jgi:hypothetical protein
MVLAAGGHRRGGGAAVAGHLVDVPLLQVMLLMLMSRRNDCAVMAVESELMSHKYSTSGKLYAFT